MMHTQPTLIGTKEFLKNFVKISEKAKKGQFFTVLKHSEPFITVGPAEPKQKKYTLEDVKKIRFNGGKNLSKNIDKILYGV